MSDDRDTVKLHMWVDPDRKTRWQQYADESLEVDSLAQLIRNGVERYIKTGGVGGALSEEGQPSTQDASAEQVSVDNSEVVEGINRIESQLDDLDDRVLSLTSMAEQSPELDDVKMKVFEVLPPQEPNTEEHHYEKERLHPEDHGSFAWDGHPSTIADLIDIEEFWVEMALDKLGSDSQRVKGRTNASGVPHYWKDMGHSEARYDQFRDSNGGEGGN